MPLQSSTSCVGRMFSVVLGLSALLPTQALAIDYSLSGFGSIVAGHVINGDGYIANYTELGIYGQNGSKNFAPKQSGALNQESRFGIQGSVLFSDATKATLQLVARGTEKYEPKVEWLFLSHQLANDLSIQAGKMRLPVYLYSDKMDVGFAYPWVRVPSDAYSLDTVSFNGVKMNWDFASGDFSERISIYAGTDKDTNSKLMSYLFDTSIDRKHRFTGIVADTTYGPYQLRVSYTKDKMEQRTPDPANAFRNENFNVEFFDVAMQYQIGDLTLVSEWNRDRPFYRSRFFSAIYQFDVNSIYITQSKFKLDLPFEKHHQLSIGYRRDIGSNMDVKFDITRLVDQGENPFTGMSNPVIKIRPGHSTTATLSFDFIF